ncbi:MAG: V-type ATPase 116kDa subunit family protein [Mycobacterium sp.]|nr:V-type ATPase 116kDa subunit family protein [Mycobacterium sp.]
MPWPEAMAPVRMERIALLAPSDALRDALVLVAAAGVVQLDSPGPHGDSAPGEAAQRLQRLGSSGPTPMLSAVAPDLAELEDAGRADLLAGEAQLAERAAAAVHRDEVAAVTGWCPGSELAALAVALGSVATAVVPLPRPPGVDPPTLLGGQRLGRSFAPLVRTFGTVPYRDIDPTIPAGVAYVVMFGMMFGDAGHGALLIAIALLLRSGRIRRFAGLRQLWLFVAGAGIAATAFGALYGEFFGPTGVLPVLWLAPMAEPVRLLGFAVGVGAVFLAVSYAIGIMNRWREGGARLALYAPTGIAGATLFLGVAVAVAGFVLATSWLAIVGAATAVTGLVLSTVGLFSESGGGATGVAQTGVGAFDLVVRLGSNLVSFARLAAFGMTHAALGWVVWQATVALTGLGMLGVVAAVIVFVVGNVLTFALEALVAGVQALRLEFYELFSRVFVGEGNPFEPWRIPTFTPEVASC